MILEGKTALITGAGRGIGQGIAMSLAEAGANVVAADLDINIARQTAEKVQQLGRRSLALEVDVTDPDSINKMVQQAEEQMGPINIAVNNAGFGMCALLQKKLMAGLWVLFSIIPTGSTPVMSAQIA